MITQKLQNQYDKTCNYINNLPYLEKVAFYEWFEHCVVNKNALEVHENALIAQIQWLVARFIQEAHDLNISLSMRTYDYGFYAFSREKEFNSI
jgi:hypothetical protein